MIIKFTQRDGYGSSIEFIERRGSDGADHNVSLKQDGDWTNIGIVVKGNDQQSYIGISVRIKNYKK